MAARAAGTRRPLRQYPRRTPRTPVSLAREPVARRARTADCRRPGGAEPRAARLAGACGRGFLPIHARSPLGGAVVAAPPWDRSSGERTPRSTARWCSLLSRHLVGQSESFVNYTSTITG